MVEFRDVVKKYAGTDEALGVPAGTVGGIPVVTPDDLGPAAAMTPAEVVTDEDAQAALSGAFAPQGVGRVLAKLQAGQDITVAFVGDSILEGSTADTPGTDDAASLICSTIESRFGVTVTKSNQADSGDTVARGLLDGHFDTALAANPDLLVISYGHNDIKSDTATPGIGYPKAASMGGIEHMVRRVRRTLPFCDIVLLSENPYNAAAVNGNAALEAYNADLRGLAAAYGCYFADGYALFPDPADAYLSDGAHPNSAGHALLANAVLAGLPANVGAPQVIQPPLPAGSLYDAWRYDSAGWRSFDTTSTTASTERVKVSGSGWSPSSGAGPWTSSTPGDKFIADVIGSEVLLRLDCGDGQGVVDIFVDGTLLHDDLNLGALADGQRTIPLTGLHAGYHYIDVTVVSGSVTVRGAYALGAPVEVIPITSDRITLTGAWTEGASSGFFSGNRAYSSTPGSTLSFQFVGTACAIQVNRQAIALTVNVTVDGVNLGDVSMGSAPSASLAGIVLAEGLDYGLHTVTLTVETAATRQFGDVFVWDESRTEHPRRQSGVAVVGEAITFGTAYSAPPVVKCWPLTTETGDAHPVSVTATGFTVAGTAAEVVLWEAEGSLIAY